MKLVILEPLGVDEKKLLALCSEAVGEEIEIVYYDNRVEDVKTLIERSKDAQAVVLSNLPYPEEVISQCPKLKYICVAFTGVDLVAIEYCKKRGITVSNCAGYSTSAVADLVFGFLISIYRNMSQCNKTVRENGTKAGLIGFELEGKKFGVVGTGAIGLRVAGIARAFGCEVYAYSRTKKDVDGIVYLDTLDELLTICDIVSLHVPATTQTKGLINFENICKMKKNAVLINTARGSVVDSAALAKALNDNIIAAAGVDVFETEPPIQQSHPLLNTKRLIATPHVAFATKEAMEKRAVIVSENLKAWVNGSPINVIC